MKKLLAILFASVMIYGCAPVQVEYIDRPYEVQVIVPAEIPEPPVIKTPSLPIWFLDANSSPEDVAKAYVQSIMIQDIKFRQLQCALDVYRTNSERQCQN